ncbi:unnamed protein product [Candida verbasci]|uniref:carnosine N-methyltransferase n=1 Tax=Candida verbasci TaxID=1227364 RepID=A0A9W4TUQ2_9ASCO|nr:unnamed protein product [Candida verbasci]
MSNKDIEEYNALTSTLNSYYQFYNYQSDQIIKPRLLKFKTLTDDEKELIPWYEQYTSNLKQCLEMNREFTTGLSLNIAKDWGVLNPPNEWAQATTKEFEITAACLLQLMREWSDEGKAERDISFKLILKELEELFPDLNSRPNVKILVPGCGLGRLVLELVMLGFFTQGNEISYHMLLTSNFVLNYCQYAHSFSIFPFLFKSSHLIKRNYQIRPVTIPDVSPFIINELQERNPNIPYAELMSIIAGSFIDLYGPNSNDDKFKTKQSFDIVVTNFFLDTASNIIQYIKTIHYVLKSGGKWINFGPWLWHFESDYNVTFAEGLNNDGERIPNINKGLELSREDVIELVKNMGFNFIKHESDIKSTYCKDIKSLGSFEYSCDFWVCEKIDK